MSRSRQRTNSVEPDHSIPLTPRVRKGFIDEIPNAYKDIDTVMKDADDLVEIRHTLRQIINVKGD